MNGTCRIYLLGQIEYLQAAKLQQRLANAIAVGYQPPSLLLLEHPNTYTLGRQTKPKNLLWSQAELEERGIAVYATDRGGDITYHGPGQLVGYPILPLGSINQPPVKNQASRVQPDPLAYLRKIEQTLILALSELGIESQTIKGKTGVWVATLINGCPGGLSPQKIASIGVKVDAQGITRHGFALNVNPDMSYWQGMIPCGLDGCKMVSLAMLCEPPPAMHHAIEAVISAFAHVFEYQIEMAEPGDLGHL
jgi:lipoyl(octanoyl) transferase